MANEIKVKWLDMKAFVDQRSLSIQYLELVDKYLLSAIDTPYTLIMDLDKNPTDTTDLLDFETNYKPFGNGRVREESFTLDRRLRVDTAVPDSVIERVESWGSKLRYDDMNVASNGVARNTSVDDLTFVTIYSYTGSGLIEGFLTTLEKLDDGWDIKLEVDGQQVFGTSGISTLDMHGSSIYNFDVDKEVDDSWIGFDLQKNTLRWKGAGDKPIKFKTSIAIKVKRSTGQGAKKFKAGIVLIHKEA